MKYDTVGKRIKWIREDSGLKIREFMPLAGIKSSGHLTHIERDEKEPGYKILLSIASNFRKISPRWLLTGEGEPLVQADNAAYNSNSDPVREMAEALTQLTDEQREKIRIEISEMKQFNALKAMIEQQEKRV